MANQVSEQVQHWDDVIISRVGKGKTRVMEVFHQDETCDDTIGATYGPYTLLGTDRIWRLDRDVLARITRYLETDGIVVAIDLPGFSPDGVYITPGPLLDELWLEE